ncbi:hypothetical protein [Bradyrhizobium zhanjiangense]
MSFKRASDELCVTPGAVSQQVESLEASRCSCSRSSSF